MLRPLLGVIALLTLASCNSRETASEPALDRARATSAASPPSDPSAPPAPALPPTTKWTLDPENSSAGFAVKHVLSTVRGMFHRPAGTVTLDDAAPARSKVEATLSASTVSTGVEERDAHLKGADFFDVAKYPTITFASTSVTKSSATAYAVTGNLTMHGVTKPVTFAVTASPPFNHAGSIRRGIEGSASVNRRDFGLVWDYPGEGPGMVVGNTITITIDAELVLQPE